MHLIPAKYLSNLRQVAPLSLLLLAACSSGGGDTETPPLASSFTIGGTVTGLTGSGLVLRNNGGDDLAVAADGTYTFSTSVANGGSYNVTVLTQPDRTTLQCRERVWHQFGRQCDECQCDLRGRLHDWRHRKRQFCQWSRPNVLQNNGGDNLLIPATLYWHGTPFTFACGCKWRNL